MAESHGIGVVFKYYFRISRLMPFLQGQLGCQKKHRACSANSELAKHLKECQNIYPDWMQTKVLSMEKDPSKRGIKKTL